MDILRIILFLAVGIFGLVFGMRDGGNLYIYGGIILILIASFNAYTTWRHGRGK